MLPLLFAFLGFVNALCFTVLPNLATGLIVILCALMAINTLEE